jgi:3-oxoacyl-[acyl-carrier protein] reductase
MNMGLLDGKVAIVTGSGRGIGQAIVKKYVSEGAKVVVNDIDAAPAEETQAMLQEMGGEAIVCVADVTKEDQVQQMIDDCVAAYGTIDILVNCAGFTRDAMLQNMTDPFLRQIININLKGTILCTKCALPHMRTDDKKEDFKKIVNFASTTGVSGNVGQANYAIAKGGIIAFGKACAREYALDRVCVNTVAPGFIETRMTAVKEAGAARDSLGMPKAIHDVAISSIPFGHGMGGQPDHVASVVLFFCSPLSDWITGQLLTIDGGAFI